MQDHRAAADRLGAFNDGVMAVIITIMVLELKAPEEASFSALRSLWPTALSYLVSYLFIAIIWVNHHHLLRFVARPTPRLIWVNFAHLFAVSLVPFATAWTARTHLASAAVSFYAAVFVCVNSAYLLFVREVLAQADCPALPARARRFARRRAFATLLLFASAVVVSLVAPILGFALICSALIPHLRPEPPGFEP